MASEAKFWDRVAARYSKKPVGDEAAYRKKLEITRSYLRPDMEVLEFGCGTGSTAIAHAPFVKQILATDISSNMIAIARDKAKTAHVDNVTFEQSTIEEINVPRESLDVVLGLSILHLLRDKQQAIEKVCTVLKPGGFFVSNTMCLGDTMPLFKYIVPIGRFFGVMPYVNIFSKKELEDSLANAGFVTNHQSQPGKDKAVFIVARKAA